MELSFPIIQSVYWLALATSFGSVLFAAMSAPVIFRTIRNADPIIPSVLSVNMEGQHGMLLAGSLMMQLLANLWRLLAVCGLVIVVCLATQFFMIDLRGVNFAALIIRCVLLLISAAVILYDWQVIWPKVLKYRQTYLDHADEPEIANPAKDEFDKAHHTSVSLLMILTGTLLGLVVFSSTITPRPIETPLTSISQQSNHAVEQASHGSADEGQATVQPA